MTMVQLIFKLLVTLALEEEVSLAPDVEDVAVICANTWLVHIDREDLDVVLLGHLCRDKADRAATIRYDSDCEIVVLLSIGGPGKEVAVEGWSFFLVSSNFFYSHSLLH